MTNKKLLAFLNKNIGKLPNNMYFEILEPVVYPGEAYTYDDKTDTWELNET